MSITLFELVASNDTTKFSPHCWKSHLALAHKQLPFTSIGVRYTQKDKIDFSKQGLLPALKNGEQGVWDSWEIACYLEQTYPQKPSLFNDKQEEIERFNTWCNTALTAHIRPIVLLDIYRLLEGEDKAYFKQSRQERLGMSIEAYSANQEQHISGLRSELDGVRTRLTQSPYLGGKQVNYEDISLAGMFMWISCINKTLAFLEVTDPVYSWYQRVLAQFPQASEAIQGQD